MVSSTTMSVKQSTVQWWRWNRPYKQSTVRLVHQYDL